MAQSEQHWASLSGKCDFCRIESPLAVQVPPLKPTAHMVDNYSNAAALHAESTFSLAGPQEGSGMPRLLAWIQDWSNVQTLGHIAPSARRCGSLHTFVQAALDDAWDMILVEIRSDNIEQVVAAILDVSQQARTAEIVLRMELRRRTATAVLRLAQADIRGVVSLARVDDLADALRPSTLSGLARDAAMPIISRLRVESPDDPVALVIATAIVGKARSSVTSLASVCRCSPRTLQSTFKRFGMSHPRHAIAWAVGLHAVWRMEALGWSLKQAAAGAGFATPEALANYVQRHMGNRPSCLVRDFGFDALATQFAQTVVARTP